MPVFSIRYALTRGGAAVSGGTGRGTHTLVVVGSKRLLVSGDQQDAVAAAVLDALAD